ncbi:MAG: trypsin-like serine protease [Calothrix sp. CSU_2_0]|nr:trypsin-like serine protease [Calothrix sp. CSU_2_0]
MINKRFSKLGTLTLCTVFALTGINTVEQILSLDGREAGHYNRVLAQTSDEQLNRRVYQKASPAVVTVKTETGHGSGFVISQDGLILTNAHVIKPPPRSEEEAKTYKPSQFPQVVTVVFSDGRKLSADVMGFGKGGLDLAILKIHRQQNLRTLALAAPGSAKVGDRVFALGTPLDAKFEGTFTQGNITRIDPGDGEIQHNAVIMGGNSGGPLLNSQGQVIGVNTSGIGKLNTGMNFSIPVSQVQSFIVAARKKDVSPVSTLFTRTQEPSIRTITLNGQVINGSLSKGDRILKDGSFADVYQFQGKKGQQVVIEMTSQKINPVLSLYQVVESAEGEQITPIAENDDKGPGDFNAQITATLPADGVFLIMANSLDRGEIGDYSLRANAQP